MIWNHPYRQHDLAEAATQRAYKEHQQVKLEKNPFATAEMQQRYGDVAGWAAGEWKAANRPCCAKCGIPLHTGNDIRRGQHARCSLSE